MSRKSISVSSGYAGVTPQSSGLFSPTPSASGVFAAPSEPQLSSSQQSSQPFAFYSFVAISDENAAVSYPMVASWNIPASASPSSTPGVLPASPVRSRASFSTAAPSVTAASLAVEKADSDVSAAELLSEYPRLGAFLFPDLMDPSVTNRRASGSFTTPSSALQASRAAQHGVESWRGATPFTLPRASGPGSDECADAHVVSMRAGASVAVGIVSPFPYYQFFGGYLENVVEHLRRWANRYGVRLDDPRVISTGILGLEVLSEVMAPCVELTRGNPFVNPKIIGRGDEIRHRAWNGRYNLSSGTDAIYTSPSTASSRRPDELFHPACDVALSHLLYCFGYDALRTLQTIISTETKLLVVAHTYAQAANVVLALSQALVAPLTWSSAVIPVLPSGLLGALTSPAPYLAGTAADQLPEVLVLPLEGTWIADCRSGNVAPANASGPTAALELVPHSEKMKANLKKCVPKPTRLAWVQQQQDPKMLNALSLLPPPLQASIQLEVLTILVDYMAANVLGQYRSCLGVSGPQAEVRLDVGRLLLQTLGGQLGRRVARTAAAAEWKDETETVEAAGMSAGLVANTPKALFYSRCAYRHPEQFPEFGESDAPTSKKFISFVCRAKESITTALGTQATHAGDTSYTSGAGTGTGNGEKNMSEAEKKAAKKAKKKYATSGASLAGAMLDQAGLADTGAPGSPFTQGGSSSLSNSLKNGSASSPNKAQDAASEQGPNVHRITLDVLNRFDEYHTLLDPRRQLQQANQNVDASWLFSSKPGAPAAGADPGLRSPTLERRRQSRMSPETPPLSRIVGGISPPPQAFPPAPSAALVQSGSGADFLNMGRQDTLQPSQVPGRQQQQQQSPQAAQPQLTSPSKPQQQAAKPLSLDELFSQPPMPTSPPLADTGAGGLGRSQSPPLGSNAFLSSSIGAAGSLNASRTSQGSGGSSPSKTPAQVQQPQQQQQRGQVQTSPQHGDWSAIQSVPFPVSSPTTPATGRGSFMNTNNNGPQNAAANSASAFAMSTSQSGSPSGSVSPVPQTLGITGSSNSSVVPPGGVLSRSDNSASMSQRSQAARMAVLSLDDIPTGGSPAPAPRSGGAVQPANAHPFAHQQQAPSPMAGQQPPTVMRPRQQQQPQWSMDDIFR